MKNRQKLCALLIAAAMLASMAACGKTPADGTSSDASSGTSAISTPSGGDISAPNSSDAADPTGDGSSDDGSSDNGKTNSGTPNKTNSGMPNKTNGSTSGGSTGTNKPTIDRGSYNFKGATITIATWDSEADPKLGKSSETDARYYAKKYVEEKYNCKIEYKSNFSGDSYNTQILTAALSQKAFTDVMTVHCLNQIDWTKRGLLYDVTDIVNAAPDKSRWKLEISKYKDRLYGLDPVSSKMLHGSYLLYNTTLFKKLGIKETPQQLYNKGQGTFAKLVEYCKEAVKQKNTYGIASFGLDSAVQLSTGARMVVKEGNKFVNGYTHGDTQKKMLTALDMLIQLKPYMLGDVCQDMPAKLEAKDTFSQNKCLFIYTGPEQAKEFKAQGDKNYAPVPFPLNGAPSWENRESYYAFRAINAYTKLDKKALAHALMDLSTTWDSGRGKAYYNIDEKTWAADLYDEYYVSKADAEFIISAGKKVTYKGEQWLNLGGMATWDIVTPVLRGEKTPSQVIEATDSKIQARIDEVLNS